MSIFDELARGVTLPDEDATQSLAARLAKALAPDRTLALSGELGAGKTTFVRGLARAWHVRDVVTSPSFTLCNIYRGDRLLVHVDAYRLGEASGWESLMIEDFLESPWCVAVEWPENVAGSLPEDALWLRFETLPTGGRVVQRADPTSAAKRATPDSQPDHCSG